MLLTKKLKKNKIKLLKTTRLIKIKGSILMTIKKNLEKLKNNFYKKNYNKLKKFKMYNFNNYIKDFLRKNNFVILKKKIIKFLRNRLNIKKKIVLYKNKYNLFKF